MLLALVVVLGLLVPFLLALIAGLFPGIVFIIEPVRMGLRNGWRFPLEAASICIVLASMCEVVPTVSYFFSLTFKKS